MTTALVWFDRVIAELALFAASVILIGGIDDLFMDLLWWRVRSDEPVRGAVPPAPPLPLAVFVPAWDEERVIGAMLSATLDRYDHPDYRIFVGCYPNDPGTIAAASAVAATDARVRVVVGPCPGPTTKADCLNQLWAALRRDDEAAGRRTAAVVLHDAEDVVHPAELRLFDDHLRDAALVQLPVVPLSNRAGDWCQAIMPTSSPSRIAATWWCAPRWARRCRWRGWGVRSVATRWSGWMRAGACRSSRRA